MTQTYRKCFGRNVVRVSSDPKCRWGKDLVITKWTLKERLANLLGHDPADLEPNFIMACAENGKGYAYEVACKDTNEFFASFREAKSFALSQYC